MSEQSRTSMPDPDPTSPFSNPNASDSDEDTHDPSQVPPVHQDVVQRLRTKVEQTAAQVEHLERENARLRERLKELKKRPAISPDQTALAVDADPDVLRDQIATFIDAIDTYLEESPTQTELQPESSGDGSP